MKNLEIEKVLNLLVEKLHEINYAFIGSVNLYIQGLEVNPRDIDILTTPEDQKIIDNILEKYQIKEIIFDKTNNRNSFRSFYKINEIEIEVLGNVNNKYRKLDSLDSKIYVRFNGIKFPCISLVEEINTYKQMGREDKIRMIQEFLKTQK